MLVQEQATSSMLKPIQFHTEVKVDSRTCQLLSHDPWISNLVIYVLPGAERRAHRRADEKHGPLSFNHGPRALAHVSIIKVPSISILVNCREVQGETRNAS
jgi:hypothetical protein